jgi:hypothetical protein
LFFKLSDPVDYESNDPIFEIQDWKNSTLPWISIVEKGGGYWIKIDTMWVTHRDDGENILTVSLSDGYS